MWFARCISILSGGMTTKYLEVAEFYYTEQEDLHLISQR